MDDTFVVQPVQSKSDVNSKPGCPIFGIFQRPSRTEESFSRSMRIHKHIREWVFAKYTAQHA